MEDGRVAVDKPLRPVIGLGPTRSPWGTWASSTVLEKSWQSHFNKQIAAEKVSVPTVAKLCQWMDLPKRKGLESFVGNLLILASPKQTNRASTGTPGCSRAPRLANLRDDMELRQWDLPPRMSGSRRDFGRRRFRAGDFDAAAASRTSRVSRQGQELAGGIGEPHDLAARFGCRCPMVPRTRRSPWLPRWSDRPGGRCPRPLVGGTRRPPEARHSQARHSAAAIKTSLGKPPVCSPLDKRAGDVRPGGIHGEDSVSEDLLGTEEAMLGRVRSRPGAAPRLRADEGAQSPDSDQTPASARRVEDGQAGAGACHAGQLGGPDRDAQGPPRRS